MTILSLFDKTFGGAGDSILAGTMLRAQLEKDNLENKREMEKLRAQQEGQASLLETNLNFTAAENEKRRQFEQEQSQGEQQSALGRLILQHNLEQMGTEQNWQRVGDFIKKHTGVDTNEIDPGALDSFAGELAKITGMSPDDATVLYTNQNPEGMRQALGVLPGRSPGDRYSTSVTVGPNGPSYTFAEKTPNPPKDLEQLLAKKYEEETSLYGSDEAMKRLVDRAGKIAWAKGAPGLEKLNLMINSRRKLAEEMAAWKLENDKKRIGFSKDIQSLPQLQSYATQEVGKLYRIFKGKMDTLPDTTYDPDTLEAMRNDLKSEYQNQLAELRKTLSASAAKFGGYFNENLIFVQGQGENPGIPAPAPTTNEGWTEKDIRDQIKALNERKKPKGKK